MLASKILPFLALSASLFLAACPDSGHRPLGEFCGGDSDCSSGLCAHGRCLDPEGDDDLDGISNGVEASLGSDPLQRDSDGDGAADGVEVASDQAGVDTDGDGKLDIVESRTFDADGDCIPDQFDSQDNTPNTDLSPMRDVVCKTAGICADQVAALGVACPNGYAVCLYGQVVGYSAREVRCDQIDENCDGTVDEGFPPDCEFYDWDGDGITDAVDVCPENSEVSQADRNGDGIGDACVALYEVVFDPAPPTALAAGEVFAVSGHIARKGDGAGAPLPRFKGRVDLVTIPRGGVTSAATPIDNAFTMGDLRITTSGTWRFALQSALGTTESAPVVVSPGAAASLELTAPDKVAAGEVFAVEADARDAYGNLAAFDEAATLTATDLEAQIPDEGSFGDGTWGLAGVSLATAGDTVLTLSAGGLSDTATVRVSLGKAGQLELTLPATARAAVPFDATLTVRDASGNVQTNFVGTVALSDDDPLVDVRSSISFVAANAGVRTFAVTLGELGLRTINASSGDLTTSATTTVRAGPAARLVLTTINPATTGIAQPVHIAVVDAFGHLANDPADPYLGTVSFGVGGSAPDIAPTLPAPVTFTAADVGQRDVSTIWYRQGVWRLLATDTNLATPSATVDIDVALSAGTTLEVTAPATAKAGEPVDVTVTMRDIAGNIATGFSGTVRLSDNDPGSNLPTFLVLDRHYAGTRTIPVTFVTAGTRTINARIGPLADSAMVAVSAGKAYAVELNAPGPAIVGQAQSAQVTIVDRFGNVANDPADPYTGTVTFSVIGAQPTRAPIFPDPLVFTSAQLGTAGAGITWLSAGAFTLAANGTGLEIPQATVGVRVLLASGLEVALPDSVKSGVPVDVTVRALGLAGLTATNFVGTVSLRDDDAHSLLPASITFTEADSGVVTFSATFGDVGARTVTASATGISGSDTTNVLAGAPRTIKLSVTGSATTGVAKTVRVTVLDALGQVANDPANPYLGVVTFDIAGAQPEVAPSLPGPTTFAAGDLSVKEFQTTWARVGTWTLRVTGTDLVSPTATANVVVIGTSAARIELSLPATTKAGATVQLTITVRDASGNIATDFADTIRLSSNDPSSTVPSSIELGPNDAGTRTIAVKFGRAGVRTVTARWQTVSASANITVTSGAPETLLVVGNTTTLTGQALSLRVVIVDAYGNVASDPADAYRGTVSFRAVGPNPAPPEYLPSLPPSIPTSRVFVADEGSSVFFPTFWFRPGTYTFIASGTNLVRGTASLTIEVAVGPATMLDIIAPASFVAGEGGQARVRAVDNYRNTTSFDDNVTPGGSEQFWQDTLQLVAGEAVEPLYLPLTIAGDYVITVDGGGLHGETPVTVLPAAAYRLSVTAPDEVNVDDNITAHLVVTDYFDNIATNFEGFVDVVPSNQYFSSDANPVIFTVDDAGERDYALSFYGAGYEYIDFNGTSSITPFGFASVDVTVLSGNGPSGVRFLDSRERRDILVNVPYEEGFEVAFRDRDGAPTAYSDPVEVTIYLDRQSPGPTLLSGTLTRTIPAGRSSVTFNDLEFDRDGHFVLRAQPNIDLSATTSLPFFAVYRAPEIAISDVATKDGCVRIEYSVSQADDAPVDVLVEYGFGDGETIATQAASSSSVSGHYQLATSATAPRTWFWNATHDLGTFSGPLSVRVSARSGSRIIANQWGSSTLDLNLDLSNQPLCQPDVSAVRAAPPWPDSDLELDDVFDVIDTLAASDVNSDGKVDLINVVYAWGVSIAHGRGDGGFEPEAELLPTMDPDGAVAVATGDFDGDGKIDLAIGAANDGIEIWLQDPAGGFSFSTLVATSASVRFTAADFDGNHFTDLAFIGDDDNLTVAYSNNGVFSPIAITPEPYAVDLAALDADGRDGLDLVYYRLRFGISYVCVVRSYASPNNNSQTFSAPDCRDVGQGEYGFVSNLKVDPNSLDGGRVYFSLGSYYRPVNTLWYGPQGLSSLSEVDEICRNTGESQPEDFVLGQFEDWRVTEGDPTTDLAASCSSSAIAYTVQDYDGNITTGVRDIDFDDNATLIALDFTGDGADDIATARGVIATITPETSEFGESDARVPLRDFFDLGSEENATLAGNFDGDGYNDLVTVATRNNFDGNITIALSVDEGFPYEEWRASEEFPIYSDVFQPGDFTVLVGHGDMNDDDNQDIVVATGADAASGSIWAFAYNGYDFDQLALPRDLGFQPATLAVGELIVDGNPRPDVAVAGYDGNGNKQLSVIHWNGAAYETYTAADPTALPDAFRAGFIGDFDPAHDGPELVLVGNSSLFGAVSIAANACSTQNPACLIATRAPFSIVASDDYLVDGVASIDRNGDGRHELVTQARHGDEQLLVTCTLLAGSVTLELGASHTFPGLNPCKVGNTEGCVEPGVGPLVGDLDRDGREDVVIGWSGGRVWEAVTHAGASRYLFGGTVSQRARRAVLTDRDNNGLLDVVVFQDLSQNRLWVLGQELSPFREAR